MAYFGLERSRKTSWGRQYLLLERRPLKLQFSRNGKLLVFSGRRKFTLSYCPRPLRACMTTLSMNRDTVETLSAVFVKMAVLLQQTRLEIILRLQNRAQL